VAALSSNSKVTVTLAALGSLIASIFWAGYRSGNYLRDIRDEVAEMRREVQAISRDRWTVSDQERWSFQLERVNRERGINIAVPEVRIVKP
jgi:hypothetical protein